MDKTALASIGIKLGYSSTDGGSYTDMPNLVSTPDIGGEPEQIDVTTLVDTFRKYIDGVKDYGSIEFGFLYNKSVYSEAESLRGTLTYFRLSLPDGSGFEFAGIPTPSLGGAEVNSAIEFKLSIALQSEVEYTAGA